MCSELEVWPLKGAGPCRPSGSLNMNSDNQKPRSSLMPAHLNDPPTKSGMSEMNTVSASSYALSLAAAM